MKKQNLDSQIELINEDSVLLFGGENKPIHWAGDYCGALKHCNWNNDTCPKLETCDWN